MMTRRTITAKTNARASITEPPLCWSPTGGRRWAPGRYATRIRNSCRSVAQRELRVLGHLVRGPRRREDHVRDDLLDAGELADELLHLLGHLGADRARRGGQRIGDGDAAAVDLDAVD